MKTARKQKPVAAVSEGEEWLSAREAAAILGLGRAALSTYAIKGRLKTESRGRYVFYNAASVYELLSELEQDRSSKSSTKP